MGVEARWLGGDDEEQLAAAARRLLGGGGHGNGQAQHGNREGRFHARHYTRRDGPLYFGRSYRSRWASIGRMILISSQSYCSGPWSSTLVGICSPAGSVRTASRSLAG